MLARARTIEDIRKEVINRIKTVGYEGGYIISMAHAVSFDVPVEKVIALYEAAEKNRQYPLGDK